MATIQGVIHGKTIELTSDPGLADGETVEITLHAVKSKRKWGDAIRESAGSLAHIPGLEESMQRIIEERKNDHYRELGE